MVRIVTHVSHMGNTSFVMNSDMHIGDKLITTVKATLVMISRDYQPTSLTPDMRAFLQ